MRIIEIFPDDYPQNKFLSFVYESDYYYDLQIFPKEGSNGWTFDFILTPFEAPFKKKLKISLFDSFKENTRYFIMKNDQNIEIGQLAVGHQKFNNRARIWDIYIDKNYQNQGLGSKFIQLVENLAEEWNCRSLVLECQSSNYKTIRFYFKNGFNVCGFDFNAYTNFDMENHEIRIEMCKILEKM